MTKRLIASALIATQLLSWASGSLYMCVASDGSVAVDGGPASCNRYRSHKVCQRSSCCDAACCHDHHDAAPCDGAIVLASGWCDCRHVLISHSQATTATRQSAIDAERLSHASIATLPTPVSPMLAEHGENCLRLDPSCEPPPHLRALGSIVLRC